MNGTKGFNDSNPEGFWEEKQGVLTTTLPETNIAHENPIFPGKYQQNGGCSMALLVYRSVG